MDDIIPAKDYVSASNYWQMKDIEDRYPDSDDQGQQSSRLETPISPESSEVARGPTGEGAAAAEGRQQEGEEPADADSPATPSCSAARNKRKRSPEPRVPGLDGQQDAIEMHSLPKPYPPTPANSMQSAMPATPSTSEGCTPPPRRRTSWTPAGSALSQQHPSVHQWRKEPKPQDSAAIASQDALLRHQERVERRRASAEELRNRCIEEAGAVAGPSGSAEAGPSECPFANWDGSYDHGQNAQASRHETSPPARPEAAHTNPRQGTQATEHEPQTDTKVAQQAEGQDNSQGDDQDQSQTELPNSPPPERPISSQVNTSARSLAGSQEQQQDAIQDQPQVDNGANHTGPNDISHRLSASTLPDTYRTSGWEVHVETRCDRLQRCMSWKDSFFKKCCSCACGWCLVLLDIYDALSYKYDSAVSRRRRKRSQRRDAQRSQPQASNSQQSPPQMSGALQSLEQPSGSQQTPAQASGPQQTPAATPQHNAGRHRCKCMEWFCSHFGPPGLRREREEDGLGFRAGNDRSGSRISTSHRQSSAPQHAVSERHSGCIDWFCSCFGPKSLRKGKSPQGSKRSRLSRIGAQLRGMATGVWDALTVVAVFLLSCSMEAEPWADNWQSFEMTSGTPGPATSGNINTGAPHLAEIPAQTALNLADEITEAPRRPPEEQYNELGPDDRRRGAITELPPNLRIRGGGLEDDGSPIQEQSESEDCEGGVELGNLAHEGALAGESRDPEEEESWGPWGPWAEDQQSIEKGAHQLSAEELLSRFGHHLYGSVRRLTRRTFSRSVDGEISRPRSPKSTIEPQQSFVYVNEGVQTDPVTILEDTAAPADADAGPIDGSENCAKGNQREREDLVKQLQDVDESCVKARLRERIDRAKELVSDAGPIPKFTLSTDPSPETEYAERDLKAIPTAKSSDPLIVENKTSQSQLDCPKLTARQSTEKFPLRGVDYWRNLAVAEPGDGNVRDNRPLLQMPNALAKEEAAAGEKHHPSDYAYDPDNVPFSNRKAKEIVSWMDDVEKRQVIATAGPSLHYPIPNAQTAPNYPPEPSGVQEQAAAPQPQQMPTPTPYEQQMQAAYLYQQQVHQLSMQQQRLYQQQMQAAWMYRQRITAAALLTRTEAQGTGQTQEQSGAQVEANAPVAAAQEQVASSHEAVAARELSEVPPEANGLVAAAMQVLGYPLEPAIADPEVFAESERFENSHEAATGAQDQSDVLAGAEADAQATASHGQAQDSAEAVEVQEQSGQATDQTGSIQEQSGQPAEAREQSGQAPDQTGAIQEQSEQPVEAQEQSVILAEAGIGAAPAA